MANAGGLGYYRVVNSPEMVRELAREVASFTPPERISMLSDEWALVRAGRHDVGTFLDLAQGFKGERTPAVMATLTGTLAAVERVAPNEARASFHAWVSALLNPALQEIGPAPRPGDTDERRQLRASLFVALGETARDPEAIRAARRLTESELDSPGSLDANLLNEVVRVAALGGDAALYDRYLARSKQAVDPEEHYRYLYALALFSDDSLVQRTIDYILSPEVRSQDAALFVARLLTNPDAQAPAWKLLRVRWDDFQKKTGQVFGAPGVASALGSFCDSRSATEVQQFFAEHKVPEAERTIQQAVERISSCAELAAAQGPKLAAWLTR
jgi:aminopeptidase N/puromycin-sensitive aminopeptidase